MKALKKNTKHIGRTALILSNIILIAAAVLFTVWYSWDVRTSRAQLKLENFCNTVDTMKQISMRYLSGELADAVAWADYIAEEHMSMEEALAYIRTVSSQEDCDAHVVDMDTFEAWSTRESNGSNTVNRYQEYLQGRDLNSSDYVELMRKMFTGEKCVLGKYKIKESQQNVISVGVRVTLREADGSDRDYLLLRVVPVERMKELWLFPVNFDTAEIGLIALNGDYVIPSYSMRSGNFRDFVRAYNFSDDYTGADVLLAQLKEQNSGLLELNNSRNELCYWYYSRLNEFEGLDMLGYIPAADLSSKADNISIVIAVAGVMLLIVLIDGAYILNINRRLRATAEVARKASDAKTQFLSSMSHDIRTPLNAVLGMTELAQSHADDMDYVQECLRKIALSGSHLLTLINDILEISRVESGRISINPAPFEVRKMISELESITRSQAVGHGLKFDVLIRELPDPYLNGDKLRLTQIYLNLLNNAVKYTGSGGSIRLEFWEERLEKGVVMLGCMVQDTGIGMSSEFQKTMYDSFTRVSDSRIDKIQGSGLGLAIVRRMVDLMNGSLECVSAEGAGTTFTVQVPLTAAPVSEVLQQEEELQDQGTSGDLTGVHILIAEDNDINWEIISEMLGGYGMCCTRAENGQICVDMLSEASPDTYDLVLMDVQMPVLNGRDATRRLRSSSREDLRRIPVVAMTADAFAEDVQMCMDAGMDAHIAKPVEIDKVLAAIRLLLSRKSGIDGRQG